MSWIAVNWKISKNGEQLLCIARNLKNVEERITLIFPCLQILIIDIAQSVGSPEECTSILSDVYSTSHVKHISTTFYKIICEKKLARSVQHNCVRQLYSVPITVYSVLHAAGLSFNQVFDQDGKAIDYEPILSPRKIIIWDLEVMIPQSGGFPTSNNDPIIMASFATSDEGKKISIYTTIAREYVDEKMEEINLTFFETELQLCEALLDKLCSHDLDIGYNTNHFDWPYLINRLMMLNTRKFDDYGKVETINIDTDRGLDYVVGFNCDCDHIDMLPFTKVAYGELDNHKLDTVTRSILGIGKTGFSISKIKEITNSVFNKALPTDELKALVKTLIDYSAKDAEITLDLWDVIEKTYDHIVTETNIKYSEVGTGIEVDSIFLKMNPELLIDLKRTGNRIHAPYMNKGFYKDINMYSISPLMVKGMLDSEDELTNKYGLLLERTFPHPWIISRVFDHSKLLPKQIPEIDGVIGFSGGYVYVTNQAYGSPILVYPVFIAVSTGSWIIKNSDNEFVYHGLNEATRHPFKAVTKAIEKYINECLDNKPPTDLSLFVSQLEALSLIDITSSIKITRLNIDKYSSLIDEKQKEALETCKTKWINVDYLQVIENNISIMKRVDQITDKMTFDLNYYAMKILRILKKLP